MKKTLMLALVIGLMMTGIAVAADTIKIGLMGPMTGQYAGEGQDMKQVVELLAADINKAGGVSGKQIEVISEDDGGDPRTAALAAQKLSSKGVIAVVGTYGSSVTEASQNIYNEAGIVQIATGSTAIRLSEKGLKLFFRTCPRDDEQGRVAALTIQKLGFKNVAILHDNTTYAKGLAEEAKGLLEKAKANIVFYDALTPGERDYNAILTKLKGAKPDGVFFTGYYPEAGLLLRQKKEMGWNVPFIGGDATNNQELVKLGGKDAVAGFYFISSPLPKDLPESAEFLKKFKEKYNNSPSSIYSVFAGDAFRVIIEAVKAGAADGKSVAEYLHTKIKEFPGYTGKISFDAKGDRVGEAYRAYKVDAEGNFVLQP
jgi:branched-chain amino acid transport system substrate-binding protein